MPAAQTKSSTSAKRVKLKPADPFELIRWLARSQSDPRKAVAELVQNSLDAGASHIRVVRRRARKLVILEIIDDGEGVIPELDRGDALHYLATHVGHSRKRGLSPQQRAEQVIAGQYGVGLLGFWAIGKQLELRTRVAGSEQMALCLVEDSPDAAIKKVPLRTDAPATFTQVTVTDLHASASRALTGRRLTDYLAAELRGQLMQRNVELIVEDRLSRGSADKLFRVRPREFTGEQLAIPQYVQVPGYPPARIHLYFADGDEPPHIQVACAGTLVADDIAELAALGLNEAPWVGKGLTGIIDFAAFTVPPGTRRGVLPNEAAGAFAMAIAEFSELVEAELQRRAAEVSATTDRQIVRDLRRALKGFHRRLPQYDFPTEKTDEGDLSERAPNRVAAGPLHSEPKRPSTPAAGPLASVAIRPATLTLAAGTERRIRAIPKDAEGKVLADGVTFAWTITATTADAFAIAGSGRAVTIVARDGLPPGTRGTVHLDAVAEGRLAQTTMDVTIVAADDNADDTDAPDRFGIIEPELVRDTPTSWRSRMTGTTWQVNEAHEDYLRVRGNAKSRMRYLLALLAKEMVQRSYGRPGDDQLLEHMVEILAHAETNLRGR